MKQALEVKKDIYWVGALDFDIRVFDIVMYTDYGTSYNAYVLKGSEKTAISEVAKEAFFDEFLERVKQVTNLEDVDYIILNHTEPDHSGSLKKLLALCPKAQVVGSGTAIRFAKAIINGPFNEIAVKDGDEISLGDMTLRFIMAPFLHWPDSMYTYIPEKKALLTCDSFGCHMADERVFNDCIDGDITHVYKYYFDCIMGPFKPHVLSALDKIKNLDIETICNGHGPVIRSNAQKYMDMYREWATVTPPERPNVVIVYASAYGYTKRMAEAIAQAIKDAGDIHLDMYDIVTADKTEIIEKINAAQGVLLGSATLVGDALPPITAILAEMNPIIHKGMLAGAFGSYGWSGEAVANLEQRMNQLKLKLPVPGLKVQFNPSQEELDQCTAYGKAFAEALLAAKA